MQTIGVAALAFLAAGGAWTADDPFVGKWRLDVSRSTIVDRMVVESVGSNRYAFNFEGGPTETVVADGTDQPGAAGTTLAVKPKDARTLTVVRKQGGRVVVSAAWKLSHDGRTLHDAFMSEQPDGPPVSVDYVYRRMSGTSGFAGAWESTTRPLGLKYELGIQPYAGKGLSFAASGAVKNITLDGQAHAVAGAADGLVASGRRRSERAFDYTESHAGKLDRARQFKLSRDGRTLTETLRTPGTTTPDVLVFERE
jgi:hypothetical protein